MVPSAKSAPAISLLHQPIKEVVPIVVRKEKAGRFVLEFFSSYMFNLMVRE